MAAASVILTRRRQSRLNRSICPSKIVNTKTLGILQPWGHRESSNGCCSRGALLPHAIPSHLSFAWLLPELKKLKFLPEGDTMPCLKLAWQGSEGPHCSPQKPIIHHLPVPLPLMAWKLLLHEIHERAILPWRRPALELRFVWPQAHKHSWGAKKKKDHS